MLGGAAPAGASAVVSPAGQGRPAHTKEATIMHRRTPVEVLDDDPLLFDAPAEWLIADTKLAKNDPEDDELGLFSLIERPELISRSWLVRERRRGRTKAA
jgi:hypothetical protein